jgi:hypothetical protein
MVEALLIPLLIVLFTTPFVAALSALARLLWCLLIIVDHLSIDTLARMMMAGRLLSGLNLELGFKVERILRFMSIWLAIVQVVI